MMLNLVASFHLVTIAMEMGPIFCTLGYSLATIAIKPIRQCHFFKFLFQYISRQSFVHPQLNVPELKPRHNKKPKKMNKGLSLSRR